MGMKPQTEPIILVDLMNLVFRSHFAFRNFAVDDMPTGVLYGVLKTVYDLQKNVSRRIIFCWDHGVPVAGANRPRNWRDSFFPEYKATRKHDPAEWGRIVRQLELLHCALAWLGYSHVAVLGLEADDVIGILSREIFDPVLIYSTDHDLYQLLDDHAQILVPKKNGGKFQRITAKDVQLQYGFPIVRWAAYLALGGDSSDNIRPLRGVGPKTAERLIREGADPARSFSQQTKAFRAGHSQLESAWDHVQKSYDAARISRFWSDPRIGNYVCWQRTLRKPIYNSSQDWSSEEQRQDCLNYFTRFCADYSLTALLASRRQLFGYGEPPCKPKYEIPAPILRSATLV